MLCSPFHSMIIFFLYTYFLNCQLMMVVMTKRQEITSKVMFNNMKITQITNECICVFFMIIKKILNEKPVFKKILYTFGCSATAAYHLSWRSEEEKQINWEEKKEIKKNYFVREKLIILTCLCIRLWSACLHHFNRRYPVYTCNILQPDIAFATQSNTKKKKTFSVCLRTI